MDVLISIHEEIIDAGGTITEELHFMCPLQNSMSGPTLIDWSPLWVFTEVLYFLTKSGHCPFLKHYLKHDEILYNIMSCDTALNDALRMFGVCIVFYCISLGS